MRRNGHLALELARERRGLSRDGRNVSTRQLAPGRRGSQEDARAAAAVGHSEHSRDGGKQAHLGECIFRRRRRVAVEPPDVGEHLGELWWSEPAVLVGIVRAKDELRPQAVPHAAVRCGWIESDETYQELVE